MGDGSQNGRRSSSTGGQVPGSQQTSGGQTGAGQDKFGSQMADVAKKAANTRDDAVDLASAASDLAGAALEQGKNLLGTARDQATGFADKRKDDAAQSVADLATSLRSTGQTFDDRPNIRAFVDSAADGLEGLADSIRERSFLELYQEAERFARARPVAVGAGAVVAGFLLARFIKSSAEGLAERSSQAAAARGNGARRPSAPQARA